MKALLCAAAAVACLAATPAMAQDLSGLGFYGTIGASHIDAEAGDIPELGTMGFEAITGRAGVTLNRYFGVEAEGSFGWEDATTTMTVTNEDDEDVDVALTTSMNSDLAVFLVGRLPMTDNANLIGRFGYGQTDYDFEASAGSESESFEGNAEGWRYGVGAEFFFDDANGVRIDFTRTNSSEIDADAYTISYVRRFR